MESLFTIKCQKGKLFFVSQLKLLMKNFIAQLFDQHIENLQGEIKVVVREFSFI